MLADRVLCPAEPTPWFPDSRVYDDIIHPQNHLGYYHDPRQLGGDSDPV